jgi:hypothetical protein
MAAPCHRKRSAAVWDMVSADTPHWTAANRWALLGRYSAVAPADFDGQEALILDAWWAADSAYDPPGPQDDLRLGGAS